MSSSIISSFSFVFQSLEAERLQRLEKNKARASEAQQKIQEQNDSFSKETEQKLSLKMEAMQEKKNAQINALRTRLQEHVGVFTHYSFTQTCGDLWLTINIL